MKTPAVLALVGTTASGKSALAIEAARELGDVEIVSVDSMQVYRGMDIGTAKPSAAERAEIAHHLVDVVDASQDYDLARFQREARAAVADVQSRGKTPLLVGGTALYLQAALDDLTLPGQFPDVKAELAAEPDTEDLHARLTALDPVAASRMEPTNRRRIVRALEVTIGSGRPFSSFGPGLTALQESRPDVSIAGVWLPREVVAARIAARVRQMFEAGLVDEVRTLMNDVRGMSRTARQALGYKEVIEHLDDIQAGSSPEGVMEEIAQRTRRFARRQRVWFRRDRRITWHATDQNPLAVLPALLGDWSRCR